MRLFPSFLSVALISGLGLTVIDARAQDGQACLAILKKGNDLNDQIRLTRKKADDEEECNAEAKLWEQGASLAEQRIALEKQIQAICAGFTITKGITLDELTDRAAKMRQYAIRAKDGCDAPQTPSPPVKAQNNDIGLVGSGAITCFGGGDCKSQNKGTPPANGGPTQPKGVPSTITGEKFGDKRPLENNGGVMIAK
jgi:hypothetical protein